MHNSISNSWPASEAEEQPGEEERGEQPNEAEDDGREVRGLGQWGRKVGARAEARVGGGGGVGENLTKYFYHVASDDCCSAKLLDKTE